MDGVTQQPTARDRRPLPGSRAFDCASGPAIIVCGTRAGVSRFRDSASRQPKHVLIAPIDADPGSVLWPVRGAKGITLLEMGAPAEYVLRLTQVLFTDGAEMVLRLRDGAASFHYRDPPKEKPCHL